MPGPLGIGVPWILSLAVCVTLAGRRLSAIRLALSVAASQFLFHALFTLGSVPASVPAPTGHHAGAMVHTPPGAIDALTAAPDAGMWVWHGIAVAATSLALHRGEHAVLRIVRFAVAVARDAARAIVARLGVPSERSRSLGPTTHSHWSAPWDSVCRLAPDRRGPPVIALL